MAHWQIYDHMDDTIDVRDVVVSCTHGETRQRVTQEPGQLYRTDGEIVAQAAKRHGLTFDCSCARHLVHRRITRARVDHPADR